MRKLKFAAALTPFVFLGLQFAFIAQAQEGSNDQKKNNQTNNNQKKPNRHDYTNKIRIKTVALCL